MRVTADFEAAITPCDLWVLPAPRHSRWFAYLDWYLNWQMCKGLAYGGLHLPAETYRIAEQYGVSIRDRSAGTEAPLLIATGARVPARQCLVADSSAGLKEWLAQIQAIVGQLGVKSVNVFLPTGEKPGNAEKYWRAAGLSALFIPDMEAGA